MSATVARPAWRLPPASITLAAAWLLLVLLVAVFAEQLRPYGITALDLKHRLSPPVGFGGDWSHPLGPRGWGAMSCRG